MAEYRDSRRLARAAIIWTWIWLCVHLLSGAASVYVLTGLRGRPLDSWLPELMINDGAAPLSSILLFPSLVVAALLTRKWTRRIESNARASRGGMPASPRWLRWWWGVWLAVLVVDLVSFRIAPEARTVREVGIVNLLHLVSAIVSVALALLLTRLIRTLTAAQESMRHVETFA